MSQRPNLESNEQKSVFPPLDSAFLEQISNKSDQLETISKKVAAIFKDKDLTPNISGMVESTKNMMASVIQNLNYLNYIELFKDDFNKSMHVIDTAFDSYIKALESIRDPAKEWKITNALKASIENFAQSTIIFSTNFNDIINDLSNSMKSKAKQVVIDIINTRLGLESALYNFVVNVHQTNIYPFYKSRFVEIYKCYNMINNIKDNIAAIKSVCGTGKTLCLPIILLCRSLKDRMNVPFVLITQPAPKQVESKENFFNKIISKYVTITADPDKLIEIYNEYEKNLQIQKLVLGVLTPHNLLPLMYALRMNKQFYPHTRILIDEIHQRTFHLDVLIAKIAQIDQSSKVFTLPINVILMSASISPSLLSPYKGKVKVTTLIKFPPFDIAESRPIIENNIQKIDNEIVRDQTIKIIEDMAKIKSPIEEGHILCFLSGTGICNRLKNSIISHFRRTNETADTRKIVILQTTLRSNETIDSYFRRLRDEFILNEGIREGKKYKNEFLYIVPLVLSGIVDEAIFDLAQNDFPDDLRKINKLICSTPMFESSFTIDRLSVVVDSGLVNELEFDLRTCLTSSTEKQTSKESMEQRKGRLGRTMKGLYVSIHAPKWEVPDIQIPPVQRADLTTNILLMKDIDIDFEQMTNLPSPPNQDNLKFSISTLIYIKAIDKKTLKITPYGRELLKYPFLSIYYAAAVVNYKNSFKDDEKMEANFIAAYISAVVEKEKLLLSEDMSWKMSGFFKEDSDITTIINPLNQIFRNETANNDEMRNLVESFGFSYTNFLAFKSYMQEVVNLTFPGRTIAQVLSHVGRFVGKYKGITALVDDFIWDLVKVYPKWKQVHQIYFKYVSGAGGFESRPTLIFTGDENLKFPDQRQLNSEIRITKRPGWNGITIPTECYCFTITRNNNLRINNGHLVHRMNFNSVCSIKSIECNNKIALNPWFGVLLDAYFEGTRLNVTPFTNIVKNENDGGRGGRRGRGGRYGRGGDSRVMTYRNFHYSNSGDRIFLSYIPKDDKVTDKIKNGIENCLKLMPYTPRSILVYKEDVDKIVEITSIGTEHYEASILNDDGEKLSRDLIDDCIKNLDVLAKTDSPIRICAYFAKSTCKLDEYDQKTLLVVGESRYLGWNRDMESIIKNKSKMLEMNENLADQKYQSDDNDLELYQFPPKFIHPALMYHQESLDCIMKWLKVHCKYVHIERVIGHRFLIKKSEIAKLQYHLRFDKEKIKQEMNLNYVAIPIPSRVYEKAYLSIREHPTWDYNNRFKVLIVARDEIDQVHEFINSVKNEIEKNQPKADNQPDETLCCCYICEDPDNPVLTHYPITVYHKDGSTYTDKACRDCLAENLKVATESYYIDGKIDQNALDNINCKLAVIPSLQSSEDPETHDMWPQIPLGQMISVLINNSINGNNDEELSNLVSAWLQGVSEYAIRVQGRTKFTFCPDHPHKLYSLFHSTDKLIKCNVPECKNVHCPYCNCWHDVSFICPEKKSGELFVWPTKCPKCGVPTFKDIGCNHITCPCGCHWCYKCGQGFKTAEQCYHHLYIKHGGCFDYHFDD